MALKHFTSVGLPRSLNRPLLVDQNHLPKYWATIWSSLVCHDLELSTEIRKLRYIEQFYTFVDDLHGNGYWIRGENLTVVEYMNIVPTMSTSTAFRYLKKLRQKGFIELEIDETDNRVKYIRPTKLTKSYFSEHGKIISSLLVV